MAASARQMNVRVNKDTVNLLEKVQTQYPKLSKSEIVRLSIKNLALLDERELDQLCVSEKVTEISKFQSCSIYEGSV